MDLPKLADAKDSYFDSFQRDTLRLERGLLNGPFWVKGKFAEDQ